MATRQSNMRAACYRQLVQRVSAAVSHICESAAMRQMRQADIRWSGSYGGGSPQSTGEQRVPWREIYNCIAGVCRQLVVIFSAEPLPIREAAREVLRAPLAHRLLRGMPGTLGNFAG